MIPTCDNYIEWFTCAARFHLLREGYAFLSFSLDQVAEAGFPAGKLLAPGSRIVGLQFLLPAADGAAVRPREYEADVELHRCMSEPSRGWLHYALPLSADPLDQQLTHQKVLFAGAAGVSLGADGRVTPRETRTFKQLVAGLEDGTCGLEVASGYSAADFRADTAACPVTMYLGLNRRERVVIALKGTD